VGGFATGLVHPECGQNVGSLVDKAKRWPKAIVQQAVHMARRAVHMGVVPEGADLEKAIALPDEEQGRARIAPVPPTEPCMVRDG
jgi:hypothetical protein